MTQNLQRELRSLRKFATDPTGDPGRCERCDAPYKSDRHRQRVFEREEAKRKAAYETLIGKLELMISNRMPRRRAIWKKRKGRKRRLLPKQSIMVSHPARG